MINIKKNERDNWECNFHSPISIDNGVTSKKIGNYKSVMELYCDKNGIPTMIEWHNPIDTVNIGIFIENNSLIDYDGVFELPFQAIKLLNKIGIKVSKEFR